MNYFNFFSQCEKTSQSSKVSGYKWLIYLGICLVAVSALSYGYFSFQTMRYNSQLAYLDEIQNNQGFMEQYGAAMATKNLVEESKGDFDATSRLVIAALGLNVANKDLADIINDAMLSGSYINKVSIGDGKVTIDGYGRDIRMIAKIEENLRESQAFDSVLMTIVENRDESVLNIPRFNCDMILKGGAQEQ